ncbi:hypothetical protein [Pseudomonas serbica]|uniref:hypothetical protein n=1 Tax=Pseudomonas serbica TaxID=2965074 RepID=UPI00237B8B13|nr:hypothetical protein [Pseudomonas serbica]
MVGTVEGQDAKDEAARSVADLCRKSMDKDIYLQLGNHQFLFIKGKAYSEKEGRIVQLQALNEGRVDVAGVPHFILWAKPGEANPMFYSFCLLKDDGSSDTLNLLVPYATVRRMVERKTPAFIPDVVDDLLERLNDMHEDAFAINGKDYYIAGEEWTQSTPGCRDLILIPVGRTDGRNVTMAVPEALIEEMISTKRTSICFDQPDGATLEP